MMIKFFNSKLPIFTVFIIILFSCNNAKVKNNSDSFTEVKNKYAQLFKIERKSKLKKLSVFDVNGNLKENYYLLNKSVKKVDTLKNSVLIKTPVKKVVCLSTTHIAFIDFLNESEKIFAVSGAQYIFNENIRKQIKKGKVNDIGYENSLDFETILSLKPDLVTVYDINGSISPTINKLKQYHIPVVQINEYLEASVLGQAEWLKFFAAFFEKDTEATQKFNKIEKNYLQFKKMTDTIEQRPTILLNMPWKGTWYIPGGKSNIAQLIKDAGGNYLWANTEENHNYALNIEEVFEKAQNAVFWLNPGQAKSNNDVIATDVRLKKFNAVNIGQIFNRNKRLSTDGGNDYMESGTVRPDLILKDLIQILHPELLKNDSLYYYQKLR